MLTPAHRDAIALVLDRRPATLAVTLRYNDWPISLDRIRRDISKLHVHLDRRLYGRRFHLSSRRTSAWWIAEKMDCSPHLHGAMNLTPDHAACFADMLSEGLWKRIAGMRAEHDTRLYVSGWSKYATKIMTDMGHLILSEDALRNSTDN